MLPDLLLLLLTREGQGGNNTSFIDLLNKGLQSGIRATAKNKSNVVASFMKLKSSPGTHLFQKGGKTVTTPQVLGEPMPDISKTESAASPNAGMNQSG